MRIPFKKIDPSAYTPFKRYPSDAGYDLVAISVEYNECGNLVCHTGLAFEIPRGYVGLLFPRSSSAHMSLTMANCVGVIDSSYRGEVTAEFRLLSMKNIYKRGDRCCQLVVVPYLTLDFIEKKELSATERVSGGYGSTGL